MKFVATPKGPTYLRDMADSRVCNLRCADDSYDVGSTSTVALLRTQEFRDIREAIRAERQLKGWTRRKKKALMNGNFAERRERSKKKRSTGGGNHPAASLSPERPGNPADVSPGHSSTSSV